MKHEATVVQKTHRPTEFEMQSDKQSMREWADVQTA